MKKTLLLCVLLCILLLVFSCVSAFAADESFDKLFSLSDIYENINFDDNSELSAFTGSFEFQNGIFGADGAMLKIKNARYDFENDISCAISAAVFDVFIPDNTENTKITVNFESGAKIFDFSANGGEISVKDNETEIFKILSGKHYKFGIRADLSQNKLYIGIDKIGEKSFAISDTDVLKSMEFVSDADFYIDNFTVSHNVFAANQNPVLYKNGGIAVAECNVKTQGEKSLVIAKYSFDGEVCDVSVKNFDASGLKRVFIDYEKGYEYRAFLWSGHLSPEAAKDIKTKNGMFLSDIVFLKNYTAAITGNEYVFTAGKPLQSAVSGYEYIIKKDGAEIINKKVTRKTAEDDGIKLDLNALEKGEYEINVFIEYGEKYRAEFAGESFCVFKNDGFYAFSVGCENYFCGGEKSSFADGYSPLYANSNIYLADFVLRKNFGIDVCTNDNGGTEAVVNGEIFPLSESDFINTDGGAAVSLKKIAEIIGLESYFDKNGVFIMSAKISANAETAEEYAEYFKNYIISDDFSGEKLTWQKIPEGWSYFNWGTSSNKGDFLFSDFGNSEKSIYVGAVSKSYAGVQSDVVNIDKNGTGYTVSADIYAENYVGNNVGIALMMRKGDTFAKMISGTVSSSARNGEWVRITARFAKDTVEDGGNTSFRVLFYTRKDTSASEVSGGIYIDNARLGFTDYISESYKINVAASNKFSWYTLGENVVYTADGDLSGIDKIEGIVYHDGSEVFRKKVSAYTFLNGGFSYKPENPGYYEAEFYAVRLDGAKVPIVSFYNKDYNGLTGDFELSRRSFAVADGTAKSFDERNEKLFVSSHSTDSTDLEIGALLGFYGARIHWIRWGDSATVKGAHTAPGQFDWTNIDKQYENVKSNGYGKIAANIYGTPKWAVKEENRSKTDYTIAGSIRYNNFAPEKQEYLDEFLTAFVNRYGADTDIIEFWNEPQSGSTAFWADGVENFANMLKTAYTSIKSANENITVSMGGMGNNNLYYTFYDELLDDADIYNYYDVMAFHGTYNVNTKLNNEIAAAHGLAPKKWWNSEGYFANYYQNGVLTDKYDGARAFAVSFLQNFKAGADIITAFSLLDIVGDEYRVFVNQNGGKTAPYGLFRSYPNIEPKLSALAAFNMFKFIDKDFEYIGEDRFDNVRAVSFKNGENALVAFWSGNSKGFKIPESLSFLKNGEIYDFEGRALNGNYCSGNKIYFALNVPIASLSGVLDTDKNNVLNADMAAPYFNAE